MKFKIVMVLLLFAGLAANQAMAQDPGIVTSDKAGWHKIGEVKANFKLENESIVVMGADRFKSIKLKVTDAPINIEKVTVYYESGDAEELSVRNELKAGAETRVLDLKGNDRELKKVVFSYKTLPNAKNDKAHVELYGLK
jgi:dihydrofolate reductase